jgi:drug/metabolite transporter (DMT)-like permease
MKLRTNFHIYAVITITFWSSAFVFTRLALRYFSPLSLGFLRYFIASLSLLVFIFAVKIKIPNKNDIKWFILAGFFGFFFYIITFNLGSSTVPASTCSLMIATAPVITTLLARIINKEKLTIIKYIAIIIEFIGVGVLTLMNGIFFINIGFVWLILASISLSIYNILQRKLTKKYSAVQTSVFSIWFGTIMLFIFLPNSFTEIKNAPSMQIIYLIILGVFPSAIAYITWSYAFSKAKYTSSVTNYMFITPFLTTLLGVILAKETPDLATIFGGIIIMIGMLIYNFFDKPRKNIASGHNVMRNSIENYYKTLDK